MVELRLSCSLEVILKLRMALKKKGYKSCVLKAGELQDDADFAINHVLSSTDLEIVTARILYFREDRIKEKWLRRFLIEYLI